MNDRHLLSIGEFAAATQLSPKALRLYDEQGLLAPARVDDATGYRYYRADQVSSGRLIRTLREMNLSLDDIARIVAATHAEWLLSEFAREQESRHAREKRAMQKALKLLRHASAAGTPEILQRSRAPMDVAVQPLVSNRLRLFERVKAELDQLHDRLRHLGVEFAARAHCNLVDPISDEEGRLELLVPLAKASAEPGVRAIPAAQCAVFANANEAQGIDFTGAQDALFDWFDRNGYRARETPWLTFATGPLRYVEMSWAYES